MNDRILGALKAVGINDSPLASLDHEQQFFALTPMLLLYQAADPASPLRQVTLRDISRIHSDHQGTLRVETASGTSITASLLGFDPNRVQRFFQTVRDTTARAKQQPTSPLPSVGSKMFSPAPTAASAPPAVPPAVSVQSSAQPIGIQPAQGSAAAGPISLGKDAPAEAPLEGGPRVVKIGGSQPISAQASSQKPSAIRIEATPPVGVSVPSPANAAFGKSPEVAKLEVAKVESVKPEAAKSQPAASKPAASLPPAASGTQALMYEQPANSARLGRLARSVGSLRWTVRVLALVLVLGALGMGYVLWQQGKSSQIPALWTVTIGVVTAVALLVLAELLKLVSALGEAVARQGGSSGD
ncbi:hypothetical protein GCM10022631_41330 [Deinococcus rubellus]|uniref:Uncharacterized protein n=1 Tax=Deinococcus rubellus TaxID=1889240 RepID=A0ABY5YFR0_9DEIO|nr:hypothetical protein [Deinococcus rubellus]UWX63915.1 hypothetical protein N0D28_14520 [Deinococcus rubellus]